MNTQTHDAGLGCGADDCLQAAIGHLEQGVELLEERSDTAYTRRLSVAANASIGGHYRHCLDHFDCLLESLASGWVDYDKRKRDSDLESDRQEAIQTSNRMIQSLQSMDAEQLQLGVKVRCKVRSDVERSQDVDSTIAREIMYVVAHGVHHFALIAVMARVIDLPLPHEFGVAPSTLQHRAHVAALASELA